MKQLLVIFFFCIGLIVNAQPPSKFYSTYGGNGYDVGNDVKQTLDGGYIITGSTSSYGQGNTDIYLLKLDSMGVKKFETTFGGVSNEIGKSVVQLIDSSYVMAGYTSSSGVGGYDVFLVKADKTGNLIWQKTIGGTDWDFANSMAATADGGFIIAGTTYSFGHGNADGYVIKTDANGDTTWTKTFGGLKDDEFKSVIQTANGNYVMAGYTKSYNDSLGDAWLYRLDMNGDSISSFSYNFGLNDSYNDVKELSTGDYLTCGYLTFNNAQKRDGIFNVIDISGLISVQNTDGQAGTDEEFYKVDTSNSSFGTYAVLGNSHESGSSFKNQVKLLLLSNNGFYVNGGAIGSSLDDECYSFCLTKETSKGYIAVGYTKSYNSILSDCFIIKYDSLLSIGTSIVGVKENENFKNPLLVYPNPFSEKIYFKSNQLMYKSIEILSIQGGRVFYFDTNNTADSLDLSFLEDGLYLIKITDKNNLKYIQKIIKRNN
jgi:hypothetical protein